MLKTKLLLGAAMSMLGFSRAINGTRPAFDNFTSSLKRTQWHDPKRQQAAIARRAVRQSRNLRQAAAGGYGKHWMAL